MLFVTPDVTTNYGGPAATARPMDAIPRPCGEGDNSRAPQGSVAPPGGALSEAVQLQQMVVTLRDDLCVRNCELAMARQQVQSKELEMRALRTAGRLPGETGRGQEDTLR